MDEQQIEAMVDKLVAQLETGRVDTWSDELNSLADSANQVEVAPRLDERIDQLRVDRPFLPDLVIETSTAADGSQLLLDLDLAGINMDVFDPSEKILADENLIGTESLIELLGDESWHAREAASAELGRRGGGRTIRFLTAAFNNHDDPEVRSRARRLLQRFISGNVRSVLDWKDMRTSGKEQFSTKMDRRMAAGEEAELHQEIERYYTALESIVGQYANSEEAIARRREELGTIQELQQVGVLPLEEDPSASFERQRYLLENAPRFAAAIKIDHARAFVRAGEQARAGEILAEIIEHDPETTQSQQFQLTFLLARADRSPELMKAFRNAFTTYGGNPGWLDRSSWMVLAKGALEQDKLALYELRARVDEPANDQDRLEEVARQLAQDSSGPVDVVVKRDDEGEVTGFTFKLPEIKPASSGGLARAARSIHVETKGRNR